MPLGQAALLQNLTNQEWFEERTVEYIASYSAWKAAKVLYDFQVMHNIEFSWWENDAQECAFVGDVNKLAIYGSDLGPGLG